MNFAKNQAKAKQHPQLELLLLKNYSLSSSTLSPKNNKSRYSETCAKDKYVCFHVIIWLMTMKMRLKMKNRSHRYGINRPRPSHRHKYTKCKMNLNMMMAICIKEHLSQIWTSIHENVKWQWGWVKKCCLEK